MVRVLHLCPFGHCYAMGLVCNHPLHFQSYLLKITQEYVPSSSSLLPGSVPRQRQHPRPLPVRHHLGQLRHKSGLDAYSLQPTSESQLPETNNLLPNRQHNRVQSPLDIHFILPRSHICRISHLHADHGLLYIRRNRSLPKRRIRIRLKFWKGGIHTSYYDRPSHCWSSSIRRTNCFGPSSPGTRPLGKR